MADIITTVFYFIGVTAIVTIAYRLYKSTNQCGRMKMRPTIISALFRNNFNSNLFLIKNI